MGSREWRTVPMERVSYSGEESRRGEPITLICHSLVLLDLLLPLTRGGREEEEGLGIGVIKSQVLLVCRVHR